MKIFLNDILYIYIYRLNGLILGIYRYLPFYFRPEIDLKTKNIVQWNENSYKLVRKYRIKKIYKRVLLNIIVLGEHIIYN